MEIETSTPISPFDEGFTINSELGRGSTGTVYKITTNFTTKTFALKKIGIHHIQPAKQLQKLAEIRLLQSLSHPNIIKNVESRIVDNHLYLIMEYAEGGDLAQLIKQQKEKKKRFLSESFIWDIFWQLSLAVLHLHSHNIMHRDIKPLNILLSKSSSEQIKLGDLADTKPFLFPESNPKMAGTPLYLAPELVRGDSYDNKVDVWALGCVLYEMITLSTPFKGSTAKELFENIEQKTPKPITLPYSKRLVELCMSLLNKKKELRPHIDEIIEGCFPPQYNGKEQIERSIDEENMGSYKNVKKKIGIKNKIRDMVKEKNKGKKVITQAIADLKNVILGKTKAKHKKSVKEILHLARQEACDYNTKPMMILKERLASKLDAKFMARDTEDLSPQFPSRILNRCTSTDLYHATTTTNNKHNKAYENFEGSNEIQTVEMLSPGQKVQTRTVHNMGTFAVRHSRSFSEQLHGGVSGGFLIRKYALQGKTNINIKLSPKVTVKDLEVACSKV